MSPRRIADEDLLQVLACDFEKRPPAPTIDDLLPLIADVQRSPGELLIQFPAEARPKVEEFAAAERMCCAGIDWRVEGGSEVTLQITTNEPALDVLAQMFTPYP